MPPAPSTDMQRYPDETEIKDIDFVFDTAWMTTAWNNYKKNMSYYGFGTVGSVRKADLSEILRIPNIGIKSAIGLFVFLFGPDCHQVPKIKNGKTKIDCLKDREASIRSQIFALQKRLDETLADINELSGTEH